MIRELDPKGSSPDIFWGEIAPCEHMVQLYEDEQSILDTLFGFANGGLESGEAVIVIATAAHLRSLERRLAMAGVDLVAARDRDAYIALDAHEALARFMVGNMPDDLRFRALVVGLLGRAKAGGRRVRAFGEMVAVLWARGDRAATLRLEQLWHELCSAQVFSLLCAYPRNGFTQDAQRSIDQIRAAHSKYLG